MKISSIKIWYILSSLNATKRRVKSRMISNDILFFYLIINIFESWILYFIRLVTFELKSKIYKIFILHKICNDERCHLLQTYRYEYFWFFSRRTRWKYNSKIRFFRQRKRVRMYEICFKISTRDERMIIKRRKMIR